MKKWALTVLAAFSLLVLALTAKVWVPWLLSFAVRNKDQVDSLKGFIELVSKLLAGAGAIFLPLYQLWRQKKGPAEKLPVVHVQVINQPPVSAPVLAPAPVRAALHQLPSPPADFTGRAEDLKELRAAILVGGVHISGLQGQGGVGKTALALKLAADLAPNFHDAQIYLDLKGVSEKPLTASEAMSHVLRAFHPEAKLPNKEDELSAFYQSVLHDKRALLLMDNAKDAAQVKSLIPPQGCALLVTFRYRFTLPGLQQKNLDTLPPEDATKLLLRIAPGIDGEADAIAKLCGYLALALRLAATAIAEHIDLAPPDYRQKLADEKQRLGLLGGDEGVDASITLSYNLLDDETQKRWRALAVFPDTFDAPAAAAVWEIGTNAAKEMLSRLLQYSMLQWNDSTKRYRLHDLMRDFARQRLTAAESDDAFRSHARHYGAVLATSDHLYLKGGDSIMRGLALFDLEWGNIQAVQAWATAYAATDQGAAKLCSGFPDWGIHVLDLRRHQGEQIRWRKAALAAARQLKDRAAEGRHLGNVGVAYADSGEYRRAIDYQGKALVIARDVGDQRGEGNALGNLGNAHYSLGEYRRAIDYQGKALVIARDVGDQRGEGNALGNLGNAHYSLGEYRRAIDYQEKARVIARDVGDQRGEGNALGNLGTAYNDLGDYHGAIKYQEKRLAIARAMGDRQAEGQALGNMGIAYRLLGNHKRAIKYHEKALMIDREIGDRWGEGRDLGNLGYAYADSGETHDAIEYYEKTLAIAREIGDLRSEGNTLGNMSLVLDKLGDRKKAIEHAEASLEIRERIEDPNAAKVRRQLEGWRNA
jgi:tetratricopeptide (TPR) repeat protein